MNVADLLTVATLLRDAGRHRIMPLFRNLGDGDVRTKTGPLDLVTAADEAAERHITIVPEIEMPGHSLAALAAYPEIGTGAGPFVVPLKGGVNPGIYSPAKEETFEFLDNVLAEVFQLFPGKYVHIGGDEVPPEPWKNDAACQALMKREGLKTSDELESWFVRRIEKFINANGKTLIGWSEIARGGLAKNAVVMDWIGGGAEAAADGHDVVMSPAEPQDYSYFDHYQSKDTSHEPKAIGGYLPLESEYPLSLPGYYFQEFSARDFALINASYTVPIAPNERWNLLFNGATADIDYLPGTGQGQFDWVSGVGAGIMYRSPSDKFKCVMAYEYGIDALPPSGRGTNSVSILIQIDLGRFHSKSFNAPQPDRWQGWNWLMGR